MEWEKIAQLLDVLDGTRVLPKLRAIHDEAMASLEDLVKSAEEKQKARREEAAKKEAAAKAELKAKADKEAADAKAAEARPRPILPAVSVPMIGGPNG